MHFIQMLEITFRYNKKIYKIFWVEDRSGTLTFCNLDHNKSLDNMLSITPQYFFIQLFENGLGLSTLGQPMIHSLYYRC